MSFENVLVTCPDEPCATRLGRLAVEHRLAACANVVPTIRSVFFWEDRLEEAAESLLLLKSTDDRREELLALLLAEHPYELPGIEILPILGGHADFLAWIESRTRIPLSSFAQAKTPALPPGAKADPVHPPSTPSEPHDAPDR